MRRLSTKEALERIHSVHGNEYEYPDFSYVNIRTVIDIKCKTHGSFKQDFNNHVYGGDGCPECYGNKIITTVSFIAEAQAIHGDKFDYSLVFYVDAFTKIKIKCPIHGKFEQKASTHLASKTGCPACSGCLKIDRQSFIDKANIRHNFKYDYSLVEYIDSDSHVVIKCHTHGEYLTRPVIHLEGRGGCIKCVIQSRELKLPEFLERASKIHHNKYDYSLVHEDFKNSQSNVNITCKHHGLFKQSASRHVNGHGCPSCRTYVSKSEINWLNSLSIPENCRQKILFINNKKIKVDAYVAENNTIYEFYGDYWHGNPKIFKPDLINTRTSSHKTMQELYDTTMAREKLIKNAGYNLVSIWEDDWKKLA